MESEIQDTERPTIDSTTEVYCKLLGVSEVPSTPEEMPDELLLPPESLGSLYQSIMDTTRDDKERTQRIHWNPNTKTFQPSPIYKGGNNSEGWINAVRKNIANQLLRSKAVISYHTHPSRYKGVFFEHFHALPSVRDVVQFRSFPQEAFIFLIAGENGVSAIAQTEQTTRTPKGFFEFYRRDIARRLETVQFGETTDMSIIEKALNDEGFAYYCWQTPYLTRGPYSRGLLLSKPSYLETKPKSVRDRFRNSCVKR